MVRDAASRHVRFLKRSYPLLSKRRGYSRPSLRHFQKRLHQRNGCGPVQLCHHRFGLHESVSHKFPTSQHPGHSIARQLSKTIQILFKRQHPMVRVGVAYRGRFYSTRVEHGRKTDRSILCRRLRRGRRCENGVGVSGLFLPQLSVLFSASRHLPSDG